MHMLFHIPLKKKEEQNLSDQNRVVIQTVSVQQSEDGTQRHQICIDTHISASRSGSTG